MRRRPYRRHRKVPGAKPLFLIAAICLISAAICWFACPFAVRLFAVVPLVGCSALTAAFGGTLFSEHGRVLRLALMALIMLGVVGFAALEGIVITGSHTDIREEPQVMLILGAQVQAYGPSILLADRLETALAYLKEHPDLPVVVSGGQGPDEPTTEARAMRDYLVTRGLHTDRIWMEEQSHNTNENLRYTKQLLESRDMSAEDTHILVVSNGFHLSRVRMLSQRNGLEVSTLAAPASHPTYGLQSYLREAPALVKSWLMDR